MDELLKVLESYIGTMIETQLSKKQSEVRFWQEELRAAKVELANLRLTQATIRRGLRNYIREQEKQRERWKKATRIPIPSVPVAISRD